MIGDAMSLKAPLSSHPHELTARRAFRALAAGLVATVATALALTVTPAAVAAPNPAILVGGVTLAPSGEQLTVGDTVTVSGTWDATEADPQEGDTFTIGLPPEFAFEQAIPFPLRGVDASGDPVTWGNCLTDPATARATCTLTEAVTAAPELVQGTWEFDVNAARATTSETVNFDLNGPSVAVDLPGTGGIDDGIELPGEVTKSGVMNDNNWSMTWTVDIPGANMVGQSTVTLRDTLGTGHRLCDPTGIKLQSVRGSTVADVSNLISSTPAAGAAAFDVVLSAPSAGFDANVTYRLTYLTCTPDGQIDPPGTRYDNSAQIQGWGDAGRGIGTVENKPWQLNLTKAGSVLGGGERNGKVRWTVTVPGDQVLNKTAFTFAESLGAGHEICDDTISGIRVSERYGPSNQLQRDITGLLTATTVSSSAQAFEIRFEVADPALQFRASDYRYVVTYTTCVSADELPSGGTAFANEVDVDGQVASETARVPNRSAGKSGRISTSAVTIDGVEQSPQTTIDWTVTIPGERIETVEDVLTLTDALSASQAICQAGDPSNGLAARLNLRVEARDQISGGGLATVNLTDQTDVSAAGQNITFSLDSTDLPIPGGVSDGFSREYQYVLRYTTCTASGGMDAPGTSYGNAITGSGVSFTSSVTQNNRGSGTGQGVTRGSVAITKSLADTAGADFVPVDTTFIVHVREIDPSGSVVNEYDRQVPLNGEAIRGLNARGTGWTIELTEPTFPSVPGVTFGTPVFAPGSGVVISDGGATATATITPGNNIAVALTNEARLGAVSIEKTLEGDAAGQVATDRAFEVTASVDTSALGSSFPVQPDRTVQVTADEPVVLDGLPIGSVVSFTETQPVDDDTFTWGTPAIDPESLTITAAEASTPAQVTVTNTVRRTVGTFSVSKTVAGDQAENAAVPETVTVEAAWDGGSKTLTLPTDGTAVPLGEDLLVGTDVTLRETPLSDGSGIAWGSPTWSGDGVSLDGTAAVVTVGRDADASVSVTNYAATSTAGISLLKGVGGAAASEVPSGTDFPVTASWTDGDGSPQSKELMINADAPTSLGVELPAGTVVTITEGTRPALETVIWGSVVIAGTGVTDNGDGSATIVVSDQQDDVTLVTVVNEATWAPGTFSIAKTVVGIDLDDPAVVDNVTVTASWVGDAGPESAELFVPTDGSRTAFPTELPRGTEVILTEATPAADGRFTWSGPAWTGEGVTSDGARAVIIIGAASDVQVALSNTAIASLGELSITKATTGSGAAEATNVRFPIRLSWTDLTGSAQSSEISVRVGETASVSSIPLGAEVRVEELRSSLPAGITWSAATWQAESSNVDLRSDAGSPEAVMTVTGGPGTTAALSLENELTAADDTATPNPPGGVDAGNEAANDPGTLPVAGGSLGPVAVAGLIALALIGFGLMLVRRRLRPRG